MEDQTTGENFTQECNIIISAVGGLVDPNTIAIPGMSDFRGPIMHTARWDSNVNLADKKVAVIGNGG